jgi:hypothetical protein
VCTDGAARRSARTVGLSDAGLSARVVSVESRLEEGYVLEVQSPDDAFATYCQRFSDQVGEVPVGGYGKFKGRLVKRLASEEFWQRHADYQRIVAHYREVSSRGDTVNDALLTLVLERQAELVLEEEVGGG